MLCFSLERVKLLPYVHAESRSLSCNFGPWHTSRVYVWLCGCYIYYFVVIPLPIVISRLCESLECCTVDGMRNHIICTTTNLIDGAASS